MPATTALRIEAGMPSMIQRRTPVAESSRNTQPEMNTAPSACCQVNPIEPTTVKAKKAFRPMPGAIAMGQLASRAMMAEPSAPARQVATNTEPWSMPVVERICGLTNTMYAIVRNVVSPASNSVRTSVPCCCSLKIRSSMESSSACAIAHR
jgi:hypothetical protein